jgi:DNA-binding NtrC family response regulator
MRPKSHRRLVFTRQAILVVDDDPIALETMIASLEEYHDVVGVESAEEALKSIERRRFDVIVSDWHMPGLDGVELLSRVARRDPPIACLLVSGAIGDLASQVPIEQRRLLAILAKPFTTDQILDRIDQLGRIAAMKDQVRRMRGPQ